MKKKTVMIGLAMILIAGSATGLSVSSDIPSISVIFKGDTQIYTADIRNTGNQTNTYSIRPGENLRPLIDAEGEITLEPGESGEARITVNATEVSEGLQVGNIFVRGGGLEESIPAGLRVVRRSQSDIRLDIQTTMDEMRPNGIMNVLTVISSSEDENRTGEVTYGVRDAVSGNRIFKTTRNVTFSNFGSFTHDLNPLEELPLGEYYVQGQLTVDNRTIAATDTFRANNPFWNATRIRVALFSIVGAIIIGGGFYTQRWYQEHKQEESRYVFPVDYSKLPGGDDDRFFEVGKIAETEKEAFIDPKDLTTHAIVAGSTGSGKSVTANVVAEEALENDIPVVVFDPTAQWTGFVKELKDENLEEHYDRFEMDPETDEHPYPGIIKEVSSENPDIDFQQLKQPGEITVFTLNQLTTEEFDEAVREIIDQIFEIEWEESGNLEMLVIFDEVHRLLEEYGGKGGYHALERGAREFRKWGIGLMMASQVTADFKQAISGNIMTEIQMQTKSMEDIERIEKKYGEQFAKRISSEDIGTGMIQNSNYNEGDPWFVDFRPTYHNPHKIPDTELENYHKLSKKLDNIREELDRREEEGQEVRDKRLELQLASDKLKEGRFKMSNMYIDSLKDEMDMS
jgi:Cdc6-like AAA superfamily ATPase